MTYEPHSFVACGIAAAFIVAGVALLLTLVDRLQPPPMTIDGATTVVAKTKQPTPTTYNLGEELNAPEWCESFGYRATSDAYVQCIARWQRAHRQRSQAR